jgi:hypothetical protein
MGPVARQVDYHQAIQSILCCADITTITVIYITNVLCALCAAVVLRSQLLRRGLGLAFGRISDKEE